MPTAGIHLLKALSHSNSVPSSVSSKNFSSTFENDIRVSLSNSEGDLGKPDWIPSPSVGLCDRSIVAISHRKRKIRTD